MKTTKFIANILVTLAAIAGAVYVVATYGEQIAAWCKKILASLPCCNNDVEVEVMEEVPAEEAAEEVAEEVVEEVAAEEAPVEEAAEEKAEEDVAEEADFAN